MSASDEAERALVLAQNATDTLHAAARLAAARYAAAASGSSEARAAAQDLVMFLGELRRSRVTA